MQLSLNREQAKTEKQPGYEKWSEPATPESVPDNLGVPSDNVNAYLPEQDTPKPSDTFTIYQLKRTDDTWDYRFQSLKQLGAAGLVPDPDNYAHTYTAPLDNGMTLNKIYHTFNMDRPEDFKGHSLSVSDMVVLNRDGKETAFYVDSMGFQELPGFLAEKEAPPLDLHVVADYLQKQYNSVAAADPDKTMGAAAYSMTVKRLNRANERIPDDHSQLKALLSHAAQSPDLPTLKERMEALKTEFIQHYAAPAPLEPPRGGNVAAIEAKVKAGESINLSDLTGAIKADKQAARSASQDRSVTPPNMRKPSIRQQIAAGREQIRNERLTMKDERLEHNRQSSIVHRSSKGLGGLTNAEI